MWPKKRAATTRTTQEKQLGLIYKTKLGYELVETDAVLVVF